ncbi:transposase [Candidatus Peregrinibacteria bacterium]|nr:transposase [Candidatus Peregrinibacteria bacterium]
MGYSGHKHQKGLKELTIADNHGFVIAPLVVRPVNEHDSILLPEGIDNLTDFAECIGLDLTGAYFTLDSGFDSSYNKWLIHYHGMIPVIKPNRRGTKDEKKLKMMYEDFSEPIYKKRFIIERTFAWQDTYRKLTIRYEKLESTHNGFKYLAYSVMNLRVFFGGNSL